MALDLTSAWAYEIAILAWQTVILQKAGQVVHTRNESQSKNMYSQLFRLKAVHILAIFALLYTGAEVAIGGSVVISVGDVNADSSVRLDRYIHGDQAWRWPLFGIHCHRLLGWSYTRSFNFDLGHQMGTFISYLLPLITDCNISQIGERRVVYVYVSLAIG